MSQRCPDAQKMSRQDNSILVILVQKRKENTKTRKRDNVIAFRRIHLKIYLVKPAKFRFKEHLLCINKYIHICNISFDYVLKIRIIIIQRLPTYFL